MQYLYKIITIYNIKKYLKVQYCINCLTYDLEIRTHFNANFKKT